MAIKVVDMIAEGHKSPQRQVLLSTPRFHAWLHIYEHPGDIDDMHCHNADQTWCLLEGECTIHFPDGESVMKPGVAAFIEGGSFYQLHNTGTGPMILMGTRSGASGSTKHINYETRQDIGDRAKVRRSAPEAAAAARA
ncbi:MAG: Cupin protein [Chloroflexi bacterium]|nr:Cupin protein [Chloroflexota bacterium]